MLPVPGKTPRASRPERDRIRQRPHSGSGFMDVQIHAKLCRLQRGCKIVLHPPLFCCIRDQNGNIIETPRAASATVGGDARQDVDRRSRPRARKGSETPSGPFAFSDQEPRWPSRSPPGWPGGSAAGSTGSWRACGSGSLQRKGGSGRSANATAVPWGRAERARSRNHQSATMRGCSPRDVMEVIVAASRRGSMQVARLPEDRAAWLLRRARQGWTQAGRRL